MSESNIPPAFGRLSSFAFVTLLAGALLGLFAVSGLARDAAPRAGRIDQARLLGADKDVDNWLEYGRTYAEQRYSPLTQVNDGNVARLGLAFSVPLDTRRGQEATPIVVDGVMYFSTAWSKVMAVNAATGQVLWKYDPKPVGAQGAEACCDVVNRGVAVWNGKVYVGTIDARLVALDAATGKPVWDVQTADISKPYTITMAPRVVKGKVIIGNSGAELGVRGYVSAYDAESGKLVWRFYTVPPNPAAGPDHAASDDVWAGRGQDLGRQVVGNGWRRHGMGFGGVRSRVRPVADRRRQRVSMESPRSLSRKRRQPVPRLDPRARSRYRPLQVALPGQPGGKLGLHRDPANDARRPDDRREAAQGGDAGAEERVLLCHRPQQREIDQRRSLRAAELGRADRPCHRPTGREARHPLRRQAVGDDPQRDRCARGCR